MAKKAYVGVLTTIPVYGSEKETITITDSNISEYFDVINTGYYFFEGSGTKFSANNYGSGDTAETRLIAKRDIESISFKHYFYADSTEHAWLTIKVAGDSIKGGAASNYSSVQTYSGSLSKGDEIYFYVQRGYISSDSTYMCYFSDLTVDWPVKTGNIEKSVARKIKKLYCGVPTDFKIYEDRTVSVQIKSDNISRYFQVENGETYYFSGVDDTFTSNNAGKGLSTATTVFTARQDISELLFTYSYSSESNDKFTLIVGGETVENGVSGATTTKTYSGSLSKGETISLKYSKNLFTNGNDDKCTLSGMSITILEPVQIGTEIREVARKIRRAYVGVEGVARLWWSGGELSYFGPVTKLSVGRYGISATSNGKYAVFAGGKYCTTLSNGDTSRPDQTTVDAYDASLTRKTATELSVARSYIGAAAAQDIAIFAGGNNSDSGKTTVDAYDTELTRLSGPSISGSSSTVTYGLSFGDYAIFYANGSMNAYDQYLTKTIIDSISISGFGSTTVGGYALFGGGGAMSGGTLSEVSSTVYAYDASFTRTTVDLSVARYTPRGEHVNDYAIFAGGKTGTGTNTATKVVDAYDKSLTRITPTQLQTAYEICVSTSLGDNAIFNHGTFAYDGHLTMFIPSAMQPSLPANFDRYRSAATAVGDYALFGGGGYSEGIGEAQGKDYVYAYTID